MLQTLYLYLQTLWYLRPIQIYYRLFYWIRAKFRKLFGLKYPLKIPHTSKPLSLKEGIANPTSFLGNNTFEFLNLSHQFEHKINWNYWGNGKLWGYNLNYFDYLNQDNISVNQGIVLINTFIDDLPTNTLGLEPYPVSLRGMNWIKFLAKHQIKNAEIDASLYAQYQILYQHQEYHLLANHLLENGFALLWAAYYFEDERFYKSAKDILTAQLKEQILADGAHYELSPMYQQTLLFRLLDCINLIKNNPEKFEVNFGGFLEIKAKMMLEWLGYPTFKDGKTANFNDVALGIAPSTLQLQEYATRLGILITNQNRKGLILSNESGFAKANFANYEMVIDAGNLGPDYFLAHAHADNLCFELNINNCPVLVNTGTSTYEANARRQTERSTAAHNTVTVEEQNSSRVWGGFRVGKRAKVFDVICNDNTIEASHDGYKNLGVIHTRKFEFQDQQIIIQDTVKGKSLEAKAYLHFASGINIKQNEDGSLETDVCKIRFVNAKHIYLSEYQQAVGFNKYQTATQLTITFCHSLTTHLVINTPTVPLV